MTSTPYDDIINLPHHVSRHHPHMSHHDRAAQFAPFAALVGYDDALDETARITDTKPELDEHERERLDRQLQALAVNLDRHPRVTIERFIADPLKDGGAIVSISGCLAKISTASRTIILTDGTTIPVDSIQAIQEL